jgi:hypothetical protein
VFVSSPTRERLAMVLQRAGGVVEFEGRSGLVVHGMNAGCHAAAAAAGWGNS